MITAWILYGLLVGVLAGAGALVAERLLRAHRLPTRWVWAASMALTVFWPFAHVLWKAWPRESSFLPIPEPARVAVLEPLAVQVTQESLLRVLDGPILILWVLSTSVLLAFFGFLALRTKRLREGWKGDRAGGHRVLFSEDLGPAVVGYLRPQIVLPAWCRELEDQTLKLILDHELEHLRAGDLRLMLTAGVLPVVFPWHLPLWWQLKRLRSAVESDCDLRVVGKYPERTRPYMELILQVGGREPRLGALVAMLSEPEETLEKRIRIMTMPFPKRPWIRAAFLTTVGGILVAIACGAPSPSQAPEDAAEAHEISIPPRPEEILAGTSRPSQEVVDPSAQPTFTPYTVRPEIENRAEVARALEREYPPLLRDAGIGGTVQVWFRIDQNGQTQALAVRESSGHKALDEAALRVAGTIAFTPALNRGREVPVWISLPIRFSSETSAASEVSAARQTPLDALKNFVRVTIQYLKEWMEGLLGLGTGADEAGKDPGSARASSSSELPASEDVALSAAPVFTPYTVRPDIKNRAEVASALEREYPPLLKEAGIGGTVQVWFFIDGEGVVQKLQVNESSGHKALDDAALRVAGTIEFTPALNRDQQVPVWISLPIRFSTGVRLPAPPAEVSDRDVESAPTFTPYTVRPDITNRSEVARALEDLYPPLLRDAGIGGTVQVWIFIDENGSVGKTQVNESSGHKALDDAALEVAGRIQFTPALNRDEKVPVWISLPIAFQTR